MVTNNGLQGVKGIKDVLGNTKVEFYPTLERVNKVAVFGHNFIIQDAKLVSDWDSEFGTSSFYIVKLKLADDGREVTSIFGGQALLRQIRKLVDGRLLPVAASLSIVKGPSGHEYYVLDNPESKPEPLF